MAEPFNHTCMMALWIAWVIIAPASGHGMLSAQADEHKSTMPSPMASVRVQTHAFQLRIPWFGQVESSQSVNIIARAPGRITSIKAADEAPVQAGEMLIELGGTEITARQADLTRQVEVAADAARAARQNLVIRKRLLSEKLSNKESLNANRQALARAQSQRSTARQVLTTFENAIHIQSPIDGVLTARRVHLGQYVTPGTVLIRVVNPNLVRIRASLFPPEGMKLKGLAAIIRSPNGPNRQGVVSRVMPERTAEGGMQVWIEGDGLHGLAPGMQLSGAINVRRQSLAVPERAVARDDQGHAYVFVREDQRYRRQRVKTGRHDHHWVEIISGMHGGEHIAVDDVYELLYRDFSKMYREPD